MAVVNLTNKPALDVDTLPPRGNAVKANPENYYLSANNEWVERSSVTAGAWIYGHSGNMYNGTGSSNNNLSWYGPTVGGSSNHEAEPEVHSNNKWIKLKSGWKYEIETHLIRNDNGASAGFGVYFGGSYGASGEQMGYGGSIMPDIGSSTHMQSYQASQPSRVVVSGSDNWYRLCSTAGGNVTVYAGNNSYGYSHSVVRCLGRA